MLKERQTFTIGETAEVLAVTPGWLRVAERLGAVPRARRGENGWRYYTLEDIERLRRLGVGQRKKALQERDG